MKKQRYSNGKCANHIRVYFYLFFKWFQEWTLEHLTCVSCHGRFFLDDMHSEPSWWRLSPYYTRFYCRFIAGQGPFWQLPSLLRGSHLSHRAGGVATPAVQGFPRSWRLYLLRIRRLLDHAPCAGFSKSLSFCLCDQHTRRQMGNLGFTTLPSFHSYVSFQRGENVEWSFDKGHAGH